jgi:hypothetical protein
MLAFSNLKGRLPMIRRLSMFLILASMLLTGGNPPSLAQDLKLYPGAKLDEKSSQEASAAAPGKQSEVYITADTFEKVYAFYKGAYKEYTMSSSSPKLPSGQQIRWAFFIIDGGKDLATSKYWMKIQRPYVGGADGQDVRDITIIQTVRSK